MENNSIEEFKAKYREYQRIFELMIAYLYTDFAKHKEYADKADKLYKELQEMQKKLKQ